jgi:NAD(P)-dependent dehydrogenase (short-subunit alcohol dehydrogenase family)
MGRLASKVAVITGGASGMGAATAERFVAEGAAVIITDVQKEMGEEHAQKIGATFLYHDVANPDSWSEVMQRVQTDHGRLDVMMNNAGIVTKKSIEDVDLETWHRVIGINLTGVMLGCQHAIRAMKRNPEGARGSIINISSTTAYNAHPMDVGYTAAKSGVRMLSKSVAVYCGRKGYAIRCNSILPGPILTGLSRKSIAERPELLKTYESLLPVGRMGQGEDIAAMALLLASDESTFLTGGDYLVDGGVLSAHPGL